MPTHSHSIAMKRAEKVWMDGKIVEWEAAHVHLLTHSLHYGLGAFEGIRCYRRGDGRTAVFRLREHVDRLFDSSHICTLTVPFTKEQILQACLQVLRANKIEDAYLRPIVFLGDPHMGLGSLENPVRVAIPAFHWGAYLGEEGLRQGVRAKISSFTRGHVNSIMSKGKICGQYVNSVLAKREAVAAGYDEAILLDPAGLVTEASGENLFMVKGGRLYTAPLSSAILAGITRDSILRLAREHAIETHEETFTRDQLYIADEVFMTGTAAEVTPVREIDNRRVGTGEPGPVTRKLQAAFFEAAKGERAPKPEWLSYV
jgi:branched-chain amino acid aminotransferase